MARSSRREVAEHHSTALLPENIPEGWVLTNLAEVAPVQAGYAFKSSWFSKEGIRLLRGTNIVPGGTRWEDEVCLPESRRAEFSPYELAEGDTVLAMDRPVISGGLKVTRIRKNDLPALLLQRVARFQPCSAVEPSLLYSFVNSDLFLRHVGATATGTQLPHISSTDIGTTPLLLPPLNEQKRIVSKIDALTEKSREAREALDEVPDLLDKLRQSILAAAFRGDLTKKWREQNPDVEPASTALQRRSQAAEVKTRRGVPEHVPMTDVVDQYEVPKSWMKVSSADLLKTGVLVDLKDGNHGANHPKVSDFTPEGEAFITAAQVKGYKIDYAGAYKVQGPPLESLRVGFAQTGDAILTHKGTVGRAALCTRPCVLTPQTTYYRCDDEFVLPEYLVYFFTSHQFMDQAAEVMSQTTRNCIPIKTQYKLFLFIPPIEEQRVIVGELKAALENVANVEELLKNGRDQVTALDASILAKAFRGELVPQDPNDEPASVLLETIRAEREAAEPKKKTSRKKAT